MGDRAAHEPEADAIRALEAHSLQGGGRAVPGGREVLGEDHVGSALPHAELVVHRAGGAVQIGTGDRVKDDFGGRGDRASDWPEWAHPAADAEVEGQRAANHECVAAGRGGERPSERGDSAHGHSLRAGSGHNGIHGGER